MVILKTARNSQYAKGPTYNSKAAKNWLATWASDSFWAPLQLHRLHRQYLRSDCMTQHSYTSIKNSISHNLLPFLPQFIAKYGCHFVTKAVILGCNRNSWLFKILGGYSTKYKISYKFCCASTHWICRNKCVFYCCNLFKFIMTSCGRIAFMVPLCYSNPLS